MWVNKGSLIVTEERKKDSEVLQTEICRCLHQPKPYFAIETKNKQGFDFALALHLVSVAILSASIQYQSVFLGEMLFAK